MGASSKTARYVEQMITSHIWDEFGINRCMSEDETSKRGQLTILKHVKMIAARAKHQL
jgi:hypothetical protein